MSHVETLFVSWPVGLALFSWLFFEIATRSLRVEILRSHWGTRPISPSR